MTDMLATGSAWLDGKLTSHASINVEYRRGSDSVTVAAVRGRTEFESITAGDLGVVERIESRDYLIMATEIDFGAGPVLPVRGDEIVEGGLVYECVPFGTISGDTHWRYADIYRNRLRIHTKLMGTDGA